VYCSFSFNHLPVFPLTDHALKLIQSDKPHQLYTLLSILLLSQYFCIQACITLSNECPPVKWRCNGGSNQLISINKGFITDSVIKHKLYMGADKSLARPGRKQATVTVDFDFHISYL